MLNSGLGVGCGGVGGGGVWSECFGIFRSESKLFLSITFLSDFSPLNVFQCVSLDDSLQNY